MVFPVGFFSFYSNSKCLRENGSVYSLHSVSNYEIVNELIQLKRNFSRTTRRNRKKKTLKIQDFSSSENFKLCFFSIDLVYMFSNNLPCKDYLALIFHLATKVEKLINKKINFKIDLSVFVMQEYRFEQLQNLSV